jgi:hypothetical protein
MDASSTPTPTTTTYKPVTVDVPEERVAEFHAFFARFLAGRPGRGRRDRPGRPHRGAHGHRGGHGGRCAGGREVTERDQAAGAPPEVTEV